MAVFSILVVDDESAIRDMLRMALEMADYKVLEAANIHDAQRLIADERPDLMLLDWMLPGGNGIDLLRRLKRDELAREMPVIMLTARTTQDNMVQGLDVGADDYVTKPFAPRELIARIKALLRRTPAGRDDGVLRGAQLALDASSHRVTLGDHPLTMGPTEFKLLSFFMSHPERAYSRAQLLDQVWGANVYIEERTVDVHIRRLRLALKTEALDYRNAVQTVRGMGYLFSVKNLATL
jgi:two-component system phosphate regulon response regulator PhoB